MVRSSNYEGLCYSSEGGGHLDSNSNDSYLSKKSDGEKVESWEKVIEKVHSISQILRYLYLLLW